MAAPAAEPTGNALKVPKRLCAAFAAHFYGAADDAVRSYASGSLLTAVQDGDSLLELGEALAAYLPPGASDEAALLQGLRELQQALRQPPGFEGSYAWLQPPPPPDEAAGDAASRPAEASSSGQHTNHVASTHDDAGAASPAAAQPTAPGQHSGGGSGLSFAAAEFRPAARQASSLEASLESLQLGSGNSTNGGSQGDSWGRAGSAAAGTWQQAGRWPAEGAGGGWSPTAAGAAAEAAAASERVAGGPAAEAAFLEVLADEFPLWSSEALRQLFEEQGGSLEATLHTLCSLEAELEGQQAAAAAYGSPPQQPSGPSFTASDFPSLGGGGGSSTPAAGAAGGGAGAAYASRARAAAALPDQPRLRSGSKQGGATPAGPAPAPIWEQREGVQRYATGAEVAREYAQLRADARDHARLRNACFQQATQAYLAGNRALAKELGAKGRWHSEQMHAAHAAAAAETFSRRNPGAAASLGGGAGGGAAGAGCQTVDLHGLHVSEALGVVEDLVVRLQGRGGSGPQRLRLVVGAGTHGAVPARLPAAVRRWLQDQGLRFSEPYAGLLEVRLRS